MEYFVEQAVNGLSLGCMYAFIALGYTMVYGIIKLINFAHSEFFMVGAFLGFLSLHYLPAERLPLPGDLPIYAGLVVAVLVAAFGTAIFAVLCEKLLYKPLRGEGRIAALLAAIYGVVFALFLWAPISSSSGVLALVLLIGGCWLILTYLPKYTDRFSRARSPGGRIAALLTALGLSLALQNAAVWIFTATPRAWPEAKKFLTWPELESKYVAPQAPGTQDPPANPIPPEASPTSPATPAGQDPNGAPAAPDASTAPAPASTAPPPASSGMEPTPVLPKLDANIFHFDGTNRPIDFYKGQSIGPGQQAKLDKLKAEHDGLYQEDPFSTNTKKIMVFVALMISGALLYLLVIHTNLGKAMRAVSYNADAARLMGINANQVISFTFFIGAFLAGIGGVLWGVRYGKIEPYMGFLPGLKAFVAAVLGGIGSIPGAILGGILLGLTETLVAGYGFSAFRDAVAFVILIVILLVKPSGLLGGFEGEKV